MGKSLAQLRVGLLLVRLIITIITTATITNNHPARFLEALGGIFEVPGWVVGAEALSRLFCFSFDDIIICFSVMYVLIERALSHSM